MFIYRGGGWFAISFPVSVNICSEPACPAWDCLRLSGFLGSCRKLALVHKHSEMLLSMIRSYFRSYEDLIFVSDCFACLACGLWGC